jgi:hypothetical protein
VEDANLTRFAKWLRRERGLEFDSYDAMWHWSVAELEDFVKEPTEGESEPRHHAKPSLKDYLSLLRYRNMLLCCVGAAGFMTWLFVMHLFVPLYITQVFRRSATLAGFIIGAGGWALLCGAGFSRGCPTVQSENRR